MSKDWGRINRNIKKLMAAGAPDEDIDVYLGEEGSNFAEWEASGNIVEKLPIPDTGYTTPEEKQRFLQAELASKLNAPFSFENELSRPTTRFDLARSGSMAEEQAKLKNTRPELDTQIINTSQGPQFVFKGPGQQGYSPVDKPGFTGADLFDAIGSVANLETVAALSPQARGATLLGGLLKTGVAGALGSLADTGVEEIRGATGTGAQIDPMPVGVADAAKAGVFAAGGDVIGRGTTNLWNLLRGGGTGSISKEAITAQKFAQEENLPLLTAGQASSDPFISAVEQQSQRIAPPVKVRKEEQSEAALKFLKKERGEMGRDSAQALSDAQINNISRRMRSEILSKVDNPNITAKKGGEALQEAVEKYKAIEKEGIDRLYNSARLASKGTGGFDISAVKKVANEIDIGVLSKGKPEEVASAVLGPDGQQLTKTVQGNINVQGNTGSELAGVIDDIKKLQDQIVLNRTPDGEFDAFEQIKSLRTRLYDAKTPALGQQPNNSNRLAGKLYGVLTESMKNPVGGNPEFIKLAKEAADKYVARATVIEKASIQKIIKSDKAEDTAKLIDTFASPGNSAALDTIMKNLPKDKVRTFKDAYKTRLLAEPEKIGDKLDDFLVNDKEGLKHLLNDDEVIALRGIGDSIKQIDSAPFQAALKEQKDIGLRGKKIFNESSYDDLSKFINTGTIKQIAERKENIASSLIGDIIEKASKGKLKEGRQFTNPKAIVEEIRKLEDSGKLGLVMDSQQTARLKNFKLYQSFIQAGDGSGAGLAVGGQVGKLTDVGGGGISAAGGKIVSILLDRGADNLVGRILINPRTTQYLIGKGKPQSSSAAIRNMSVALSLALSKSVGPSDQTQEKNLQK